MNCPVRSGENADVLVDYCAHSLDAQRAILLEQHMVDCVDCQAFHDAQAMLWSKLEDWRPFPVSPNFDRKLFSRIDAEAQLPLWRQWRSALAAANLQPVMFIAVACVVFLAAGLLQTTRHAPQSPEPAIQTEVRVGAGEVEQAVNTLEDLEMLRALPVVAASRNPSDKSI